MFSEPNMFLTIEGLAVRSFKKNILLERTPMRGDDQIVVDIS